MHDTELELLARQLAEGLRGDHDGFCRELVRLLAHGHPVTRERLATVLQVTAEQVAEVLAGLADLEVDPSGNVVGWGLTFIPTFHRFRLNGHTFYTWCALDALVWQASSPKARLLSVADTYHVGHLIARYRYPS